MAYQAVFKRYELKYLLTAEQKERLLRAIGEYIVPDRFSRTDIRNIYFDTDDYRLIRRSIEKPAYKEKLRIRSYGQAGPDSTVFVELKKKYNGVVYKRRLALGETQALDWICGGEKCPVDNQIVREIDYFLAFYKNLSPKVFLSYEREAYCAADGSGFRVTFDDNILSRRRELSLEAEAWGDRLLDRGMVLMELKCSGGIPLWMVHALAQERVYKTSFSKYGTAYEKTIINDVKGKLQYA